jgi:uncharacterized protein YmfQ (DUF2313 family)
VPGIDAYSAQLRALLPKGRAWLAAPGSVAAALLEAAGAGMARIDARTSDLIAETSPLTAIELLPDWELMAGLPDSCLAIAEPLRDRQLAVSRKLAGEGGQSSAFLIGLAAQIGIQARISEFAPFTTESTVDGPIYDDDWSFAFEFEVLADSGVGSGDAYIEGWLTTESGVDEYLRTFGLDSLECLINRAKPAHTIALFIYPTEIEPIFWFDFLSDQGDY